MVSAGGEFQPDGNKTIEKKDFLEYSILKEVDEELHEKVADSLSIKFLGLFFDSHLKNKPNLCFLGNSSLSSNEMQKLRLNNKERDIKFSELFFIKEEDFLNNRIE